MPSPREDFGECKQKLANDFGDAKIVEAAFYSVKKSLNDSINTKEELQAALCLAGRNPSSGFLESTWKGNPIKLSDFKTILPKVEALDEAKLIQAFSKLSPKKKKQMPRNQLTEVLTSCGESLTENEIKLFLDSITNTHPDIMTENGEIAFENLSTALCKAANESKQRSLRFYEQKKCSLSKKIARSQSGSSSGSRRKSSLLSLASPEIPANIQNWTKSVVKGAFFFDEETDHEVICHHYKLEVVEDTLVFFSIKTTFDDQRSDQKSPPIDVRLFIISTNDAQLKMVNLTKEKNKNGEYSLRTSLKVGTYVVIPFTTGCRFVPKSPTPDSKCKLLNTVNDKIILLYDFTMALSRIFKIMDLDGNNLLSRQEFNLFNWRTSGEEVADDEWAVVQDNFELENGELTLNGFLDLHQMEAEDSNGEDDDLWVTLFSMGFNEKLLLSQICPFQVSLYSPSKSFLYEVIGIKSANSMTMKALCKYVIDHGQATKIASLDDSLSYQLTTSKWICIVIKNNTNKVVSVQLDCSKSTNCVSHRQNLRHIVKVDRNAVELGHHLMPSEDNVTWNVIYKASVVE